MITIYAILLYLMQITNTGYYTQEQMNSIVSSNQPMITSIQANQTELDLVNQEYLDDAGVVIVNNPNLQP